MKKMCAIFLALVLFLTGCGDMTEIITEREGTTIDGISTKVGGSGFSGAPLGPLKTDLVGSMSTSESFADGSSASPSTSTLWVSGPSTLVYQENIVNHKAGQLTSGEWNDNRNWDFWCDLLNERSWNKYIKNWELYPTNRETVIITNDGNPIKNVKIQLVTNGKVIFTGVTDQNGTAYLFSKVKWETVQVIGPDGNIVKTVSVDDLKKNNKLEVEGFMTSRKLDLMFAIDTTGSMSDELEYLKSEIANIIERVSNENKNIEIRTKLLFYRDTSDEYVIREFDFTKNIDDILKNIKYQSAGGGGDYEEAVDLTLLNIAESNWDKDSTKLAFMVLDAPPHQGQENLTNIKSAVEKLTEKGVRIIPIASSGVDESTEFLLRTLATLTNGTYTFLTNDSGIGNGHLEPTIGKYKVELLNELIIRIINQYCL